MGSDSTKSSSRSNLIAAERAQIAVDDGGGSTVVVVVVVVAGLTHIDERVEIVQLTSAIAKVLERAARVQVHRDDEQRALAELEFGDNVTSPDVTG